MELTKMIDEYKALLDRKDELKSLTSQNNEEIENARQKIAEVMINEEIPMISRNGFRYSLLNKVKYSKKAGADEKLFALLRESGLGDLIVETVNARTLQSAMSNLAEENDDNLPDEFNEVINKYEYLDVQKRKETKKL